MSTRLWHPFADMAVVKDAEVVIARGQGARVWDEDSREYIDARGGLWYCAVGHGRAELADAAAAQMRLLAAYDTFDRLANRPALELAERVSELAPFAGGAVFFTSGGSEAVDTAAKLARRYWHALGRPEKQIIVHRQHAYHGMNAYGTSLAGIPSNREGFGTLIPDVASVSHDDPADLAAFLAEHGDRVAAFIGEPVIGAGGILHPPAGYWAEVQALCRSHDVLLVADEVITGFGRTGRWFGVEHFGAVPDVITFGKGIGGGVIPLSGMVASRRVREVFEASPSGFSYGHTFSGNPLGCAVGCEVIDIIEQEGLLEAATTKGERLRSRLDELMLRHSIVHEVRGLGLLRGIELRRPDGSRFPAEMGVCSRVSAEAKRRGLMIYSCPTPVGTEQMDALLLAPPLIISDFEIDEVAELLDASLGAVEAAL
jgi:putrescine aminotransferase